MIHEVIFELSIEMSVNAHLKFSPPSDWRKIATFLTLRYRTLKVRQVGIFFFILEIDKGSRLQNASTKAYDPS